MSEGKVEVFPCGPLSEDQARKSLPPDWPSGEFITEVLEKHGVRATHIGDATYWQASARWALLSKFDLSPLGHTPYKRESETSPKRKLSFSIEELQSVKNKWETICADRRNDHLTGANDLLELIQTSKSNGRSLKWSFMKCDPGCQFRLHAHPNVELVYCALGALHEVRMSGPPIPRHMYGSEGKGKVRGPNIQQLDLPWSFGTLYEGEWLVNEPGSIHKSFTATNGQGCLLMILWGGFHADIPQENEPKDVNVHEAVNSMDDQLSSCDCASWDRISETFLPQSERSVNLETLQRHYNNALRVSSSFFITSPTVRSTRSAILLCSS
mmetsp:Transcript_19214/g.32921  ORF Transcript_19214/g.32921 Transcript_19214/m.32921 type:complete len:326 (-) Transcript_19214:1441-2418(-)